MTNAGHNDHEPLLMTLTRVHADLQSGRTIDAGVMALLARRLITLEVAPGGPYKNEAGVIDSALNRMTAEVFGMLGVTLPGAEAYNTRVNVMVAHDLIEEQAERTPAQRHALDLIETYAPSLRSSAKRAYESILRVDRHTELSGLSERFMKSLVSAPAADTATLGAANLLTWIAYSLYDDLIDGEGTSSIVPVANAAHRDALELYRSVAPEATEPSCNAVFRAMDEANAWELAHCRAAIEDGVLTITSLPQYGRLSVLAERSRAHVLGPRLISEQAGFTSEQRHMIYAALDDYLIARQLNDDLHDWAEDIANGHLSPVVSWLLRQAGIESGTYALDDLTTRLQRVFWERGLSELSLLALRIIKRSQRSLRKSGLFTSNDIFTKEILLPIRSSLEQGLRRHQADKQFYEAYVSA